MKRQFEGVGVGHFNSLCRLSLAVQRQLAAVQNELTRDFARLGRAFGKKPKYTTPIARGQASYAYNHHLHQLHSLRP